MQIIVTGATSFLGAAVSHRLLEAGHEVIAVLRPDSRKRNNFINDNRRAFQERRLFVVENDISAPEELPAKMDGILKPGSGPVFCHFAWEGSGSEARTDMDLQQRNLDRSMRTLKVASELGCSRFIFAGSQAEYGRHTHTVTEGMSCSPATAYGIAKHSMSSEGEALAKMLGIRYIHARIFSVYGSGDHPWTLVESCLDAFLADREILLGPCTQLWNFLNIEDFANAFKGLIEVSDEALEEADDPIFNVAGNDTRPLKDFVEEIHELCGGRGTCRYGERENNAEGYVNLDPSIDKIRSVTGWSPRIDFDYGISQMIEYRKFMNQQ